MFLRQCSNCRPSDRMCWPADVFMKNLQIWNLLKSMWAYIYLPEQQTNFSLAASFWGICLLSVFILLRRLKLASLFSNANISHVRFVLHLQDWWCVRKRETSFPVNKLRLIDLLPSLWPLTMKNYLPEFLALDKVRTHKNNEQYFFCESLLVLFYLFILRSNYKVRPSTGEPVRTPSALFSVLRRSLWRHEEYTWRNKLSAAK